MIVNKISNNIATPSFKAKADENEAKKFIEGFKNLEKDFPSINKNGREFFVPFQFHKIGTCLSDKLKFVP